MCRGFVLVAPLFACNGASEGAPIGTSGGDEGSSRTSPNSDSSSSTEASTGTVETGEVPPSCGGAVANATLTCLADYGDELATCYQNAEGDCDEGNGVLEAALDLLETEVTEACADGELFGLSVDALVGRLQTGCEAEASSLAWRSFGGPHGSLWETTDPTDHPCLLTAHTIAKEVMGTSLSTLYQCLLTDQCDLDDLDEQRAALISEATADIEQACEALEDLTALTPALYLQRAMDQVDCVLATSVDDPSAVPLSCGATNVDFEASRGEWTQVVVDGEKWGTLCGDESDYAFWIRPAPQGQPLDRVLIALQGGGVCLFEDDCAARLQGSPELFNALDDVPLGVGIASDDPAQSPFADWTKVYLPYCTQDVFAGGGVMEDLGGLTLPRYGSVNLRSSLRMVRDFLWRELDEESEAGYRPDELIALFGGFSAGAYGTNYNYHWLLDDLQWPRTAAYPDAGLGLDNGSPFGVSGLGLLKIPDWGMLPNLPPYCFAGECAVGPVLFEALSRRLQRVPEQQMLVVTNPRDSIQQGDAFFDDEATWINELRRAYCETSTLPGIHWYLTSVTDESVHVVTLRPELWNAEVDGETMRDWFTRAIDAPQTLESRAEEADFIEQVPGVEPFPCAVAP